MFPGKEKMPVEDKLFEKIVAEFNFDRKYAQKCIEDNRHNHITACYHLIDKRNRKLKDRQESYQQTKIDFKKKMLAESERRVKAVDAAIGKKNWESVRRDLDGQVYNMRNTMNYLAAGPSAQPGAKAAAKQFYQDMEAVNLLCKRKKQAAAQDAYGAMMSSLDSFNKLI